jgi:Protein of unknown function (DUF3106)
MPFCTAPFFISSKKWQKQLKRLISGIALAISLSLMGSQLCFAQNWNALTDGQKEILTPLESDWSNISQDRKKKWLEIANRYPQMSDAEKNTLQSRMSEWASLSPDQRRLARDNYLRSLKFSPEKKAEAWQSYQQLSEEDKKKLAAKKANSTKPSAVSAPTLK